MKKHKFLPFIICISILLVLFAQNGLLAKSSLFLDVEKEGRSTEINADNSKKGSLIPHLPGDVLIPVLASLHYCCTFFAIAEMPAGAKIPLPFLGKLLNHSPPSFL